MIEITNLATCKYGKRFQINLSAPDQIKAALADSGFRVQVSDGEGDQPAELQILDDIGDYGVSAADVSSFLGQNQGQPVSVTINSFGGSAYDGLVMFNALSSHDGPVTTTVSGIAYSAASLVFLAGDDRRMHEASDFGIHRAWSGAVGNQNVMLAMADWLGTLDGHMVDLYSEMSGESQATINEWVNGKDGMSGTVFAAKEALAAGFATEVIPTKKRTQRTQQRTERAKQAVTAKYQAEMAALARGRHRG